MCGRFVEINHAKQQINTFSGNLFIPLTNRHNLWIIIICKKCSVTVLLYTSDAADEL